MSSSIRLPKVASTPPTDFAQSPRTSASLRSTWYAVSPQGASSEEPSRFAEASDRAPIPPFAGHVHRNRVKDLRAETMGPLRASFVTRSRSPPSQPCRVTPLLSFTSEESRAKCNLRALVPYFDGPLSRADCLSVLAWGPATWRVWLTRSWVSTSPSTSPTHQVRARSGTFTPLSLARARGAGLLWPSSDSLNLTLPAFPTRATLTHVVRSLLSVLAPRIGEFY